MRWLLHLVAVILLVIATVLAFGWIGNASIGDVLGYGFAGVACFVASLFTPPVVPPK